MAATHDEMISAVREKTFEEEGKVKLTCASALGLADRFDVKPSVIGGMCNDNDIRICHCQLGCFE
jgi:hypothetical protein